MPSRIGNSPPGGPQKRQLHRAGAPGGQGRRLALANQRPLISKHHQAGRHC